MGDDWLPVTAGPWFLLNTNYGIPEYDFYANLLFKKKQLLNITVPCALEDPI